MMALIVIGLALLVLGARWLVGGAVAVAQALGVSDLLIGLTIVAAGTSMPEVATSVMASIRGQRDIAIGNVVGSNIFNLLAVLGSAAIVAPDGVPVAPQALRFDIPVMTAVALACLPIFFTAGRIARWEGCVFLAYYTAYITFLVLSATRHAALDAFSAAMLWFAVPLTVLGLGVSLFASLRARPARSDPA
jgi:cation:H+ antiporter